MVEVNIVSDAGLSQTLSTSNKAQLVAKQLTDLLEASLAAPNSFTREKQTLLAAKYQELDCELSQLRLLNRSAVMSARNTKAQTAEARQEVDRLHLQLQNLYYEQRHLQGEIEACKSYE